MSRQDPFYKGEWYGLPAPLRSVPFGKETRCRDEFRITAAQLSVVVAVVAADFVGLAPVSAKEIDQIIDGAPHGHLWKLTQMGWLEETEKRSRSSGKLYKPTAKAWRELGLQGWSLLKEVA